MARILLTATLFSLAFSPQLMAAEAQLKKTVPTATDECKKALDDCQNKWKKATDSKTADDYSACNKTCREAATIHCKNNPGYKDATHSRDLSCRTGLKALTNPRPKNQQNKQK